MGKAGSRRLTERLIHRKVGSDHKHRCSRDLGLLKDVSPPPSQHTIDTTHSLLRALQRERRGRGGGNVATINYIANLMHLSHCSNVLQLKLNFSSTHLNLAEVDWLQDPRLRREHAGIENPAGGGDDLTTASVDGVRVEGHVVNVEPHSSQVLFTEYTL